MGVTHHTQTAQANNPAYDVSHDAWDEAHDGTNDHGHTGTGDGGTLAAPTLAAVLAVGADAALTDIYGLNTLYAQNAPAGAGVHITQLLGGTGDAGAGAPGGYVEVRSGANHVGGAVNVYGGDSPTVGYAGGAAAIGGGSGSAGGHVGAAIWAAGGTYSAHGKIGVKTNNESGTTGQALVSDGASKVVWGSPAGVVPVGGIIMWSGTIATIPSGWALCNGMANSPGPDLRDQFIVGARSDDAGVAKTNLTGSLTVSGGSVSHHHASHSFTQPGAHSNHTFTQPSAHTSVATKQGSSSGNVITVGTHSGGGVDAHSAHSGGAVDAHDTLSAPQPYFALAFIQRMS